MDSSYLMECISSVTRSHNIQGPCALHRSGKDTLTMTHDQIAKYTGSAREVVSRMLKYFENEGMVELGRGRVRLKDKKRLKELARQ